MTRNPKRRTDRRSRSSIRLALLGALLGSLLVPISGSADEPRGRTDSREAETSTETPRSATATRSAQRARTGDESRDRVRRGAAPDDGSKVGKRRHHRAHRFPRWYGSHGHWSWWWGGWGWSFNPGVVVIHDRSRGRGYGALDLDVRPEEAEVWVDGRRVGIADNYDGFPTYLWLPAGDYEVVYYHPGYRTIHREYAIYDGMVIDVDDAMDRGEAIPPEELFDRPTPRRDARIQRDRERRLEAERDRRERSWRERRLEESRDRDPKPYSERNRRTRDPGDEEPWRERRGADLVEEGPTPETAVRLRIVPGDASIYLDGSFLGLAEDVQEVPVSPGSHRIEVVRPGYEGVSETLDSEPGEVIELVIELEED